MKRIVVGATLALGALALVVSPAAAGPKKKQGLETQRSASTPVRQKDRLTSRNASYTSGHSVGLDGRVEYCAGF